MAKDPVSQSYDDGRKWAENTLFIVTQNSKSQIKNIYDIQGILDFFNLQKKVRTDQYVT